jgi:hypothetical protein
METKNNLIFTNAAKNTLVALAVTALGMLGADAATIALNNGSFESPSISLAEWYRAGTPPGWWNVNGGGVGVQFEGPVGSQCAYFDLDQRWSIIKQYSSHTIELAGEEISLTAWVKTGNHALDLYGDPTTVAFTLQLIIEGQAKSYLQNYYTISTNWTLVSAPTYTTTVADIGKTVGVYTGFSTLEGRMSQGFLDGVSMTTIPEPSAAILGSLSLLGFLRRRRSLL